MSWTLPPGEDVIADHRLAVLVKGNPTIAETKVKGLDGEWRHGDGMVASLLGFFSSRQPAEEYGYEPVPRPTTVEKTWHDKADDWADDDDDRRSGRSPLPVMRGAWL